MLEPLRRSRPLALVAASIILAACSSDDGTGPGGGEFNEQSATATASAVAAVSSSLNFDQNAAASFNLISGVLGGAGPAIARAPLDVAGAVRTPLGERMRLATPSIPLSPQDLLPQTVLGKTFVYDPGAGEYVEDQGSSGAPSDGVRFVYYAVSPTTGQIVTPLNALGYIEFRDLSTSSENRVGFKIFQNSGSLTLADYSTGFSQTGDETIGTESLSSGGYVADADGRIDFTLAIDGDHNGDSGGTDFDVVVENDAENVSLHLEGSVDYVGEDETQTVDYTVQAEGNTAVMHATTAVDEVTTGDVVFNGTTVAEFTDATGQPVFTHPDGGSLTQGERNALVSLYGSLAVVFLFALNALTPLLVLFGGALN